MFYNCDSLISFSEIYQEDISFGVCITNMSRMFYGCKLLEILPDFSKWNTSGVIDMSYMFYGCKSLKLISNISDWNTFNVFNIENFFGNNFSFNFPENYILNLCKNSIIFEVVYIPNISNIENKMRILGKEFIKKNKDKGMILYNNTEFELNEYFDDIDNLNKSFINFILCLDKSINDISYIFYGCDSLVSVNIIDNLDYFKDINQSKEKMIQKIKYLI